VLPAAAPAATERRRRADGAAGTARLRQSAALPALAVILALAAWFGVAFGSAPLPLGQVLAALAGGPAPALVRDIVWNLRLPRVVVAGAVGTGLAVAGCVLQGIFRNPMADPGVLGVSSGAGLGAVVAIYAGLAARGIWTLPAVAFAGALLTAATVYGLATRAGRTPVLTLLLAGIAVGSLLTSAIGLVMILAREVQIQAMVLWLMGGFDGETWQQVGVTVPVILVGTAACLLFPRELNILATGEESARGVGVPVEWTKRVLLALCALVTAAGVAVSGTIGFVGLLVPHMLRLLVGPDHRRLLPASALGGAAFLILADLGARLVIRPAEISVGVITSFLGVPFFLYLLRRQRAGVGA
jgi:iron complex transport system permease protein